MSSQSTMMRTLLACLAAAMATFTSTYAAAAPGQRELNFLGISRDGSSSSAIEDALQRRLQGLEFQVKRVSSSTRCTSASCFAAAAHGDATPLVAGRILANDRACVATLWFYDPGAAADTRLVEREVSCRPEWNDAELAAPLASAAGELAEAARHVSTTALASVSVPAPATAPTLEIEPPPAVIAPPMPASDKVKSDAPSITPALNITAVRNTPTPSRRWAWNGSRRGAVAGTALLFAGALAATVTLSFLDGSQSCRGDAPCFSAGAMDNPTGHVPPSGFRGPIIGLGTLAALSGVAFITIVAVP